MTVHRQRLLWALAPVSMFLLALALAGCAPTPQTTLLPKSDYAARIQGLFELILVIAAIVFVVVEGFLIYTAIRFRKRKGQDLPAQSHGSQKLEIAWTFAPVVVLAIITVPTISTIFATQQPAPADALEVKVMAHQWWWEFSYPSLGIVTGNEMHIPVGKTTSLVMKSNDVIHSFWVPQLAGKRDVFPNRETRITFIPDEPGTYLGQCAEFCGLSHANMRFRVVVHTPEDFQAWVKAQKTPSIAPTTELAKKGQQLFFATPPGCTACHTIDGTQAKGLVGPNLTRIGARGTTAAGTLENTPDNMARWLTDPEAVKPGSKMPNLHLSESDISALVAFLESMK
ncbi:MAG: cytochrome c oxidase subunit II [Dehalococcoidia bacterium]|nr:cytochrome c oxidase subunit II [Dehalococcoidia bacterium]